MGNAPRPSQPNEVISIRAPRYKEIHTTSISMMPDIDLEVHLHKNSFKLVESLSGISLIFKFDSLCICLITVYYFGVEIFNKNEDHTLYFAVDTEKYPKPSSYKFPKGMNYEFPVNTSVIPRTEYERDVLSTESHNQYHVVVTIKPAENSNFPYESSFLKIEREKEEWKVTVLKQKIHFENMSFYLNEIYGLSGQGEDNNCVVCLSGKSKVTLMPCKHLCLCDECARILTEATVKKCPICRTCNFYVVVNELIFIQE